MRGAIRSAKACMMMDNDGQRDVQLGAGVSARMQRKRARMMGQR